MENILLVMNGSKPDSSTVEFACYIANLTHSKITGFFIENIKGEKQPALKQLYALPYVETITAEDFPENKEKMRACEQNEKLFADSCINRGVNYHVHTNREASVKDIIYESRFADMIIVNADTSFEKIYEGAPSHFVKDILTESECPVIIAPYNFYGIDEIVFTYDGNRSSVFAIKQFVHLFPSLKTARVTVLQIDEKSTTPFKDKAKIEDLLRSHYVNIEFQQMVGNPSDELFGYLLEKKNVFVVMGAYGRGTIANLFKASTANLVVKTVNLPLFIAHQ